MDPAIAPPTVRLRDKTLMAREPFMVTAPVPMFRSPVPAKAKSPFQIWVLLLVSVFALPLVLSIVPPLIRNVPLPVAVLLLKANVPALSMVVPL